MIKYNYRIKADLLWITVDCDFEPNDALITILDFVPGVIWVGHNDNYTLRVAYQQGVNPDKLMRSVANKINNFLKEI